MNNLHRELAPISDAAWAQIEEETSRTLKRYLAGRRVVDVQGPGGIGAVRRRHRPPADDRRRRATASSRGSARCKPLVELRVPFELDRQAIDDVERGANDSDWQPAKDAARQIAFAEDRAIFEGYAAAGIEGIRQGTSNPIMTLPADVRDYPDAIAQALSQLRLVGVNGPYSVLLGADAYTALSRDQRPRLSGAGAHQAAGQRRDHLGARHRRRLRADHARRRFRPAHRPGRLDRLSEPHRQPRCASTCRRRSRSCCSPARPPSRWRLRQRQRRNDPCGRVAASAQRAVPLNNINASGNSCVGPQASRRPPSAACSA